MARKYLRGLPYTTSTNGRDIPIFLRLCYEFWGYCVNGTSSLTTPGGMPTTPTSGPANFFEGTSVLATGNDGVTSDLGVNFTSPSGLFNISYINKYITIWSHTDTDSTDNSIYRIVNVLSTTQLVLAPFSGGTRDNTTLKNNLTSRSALNYRIIDPVASSQLSVASGNYFVGTLTGAPSVNAGQANSQFQILLRGSSLPFGNIGVVGSPDGYWNGSTFTGFPITERTAANATFTGTVSGRDGAISMIADTDFFIAHINSANSGNSMYFYIMIPERVYDFAQDPNPMAILVGSNGMTTSVGTESLSTAFFMNDRNGVTRACQLITKNFAGDGTGSSATWTFGPNLNANVTFNALTGKIPYSDAIISNQAVNTQFALTRGIMRTIKFTSSSIPRFHLVGDNGEYIHVGNGILWPWDGSIMPYNLLPLGP